MNNCDLPELLKRLRENARPVSEIKIESFSRNRGLYGFFLREGSLRIGKDEFVAGSDTALYIGKTESSQKARNAGQHLSDNGTGSSTVRRSLGALLLDKLGLVPEPRSGTESTDKRFINYKFDRAGERELTQWMSGHLSLGFCASPKADLKECERRLIKAAKPVLNLDHNRASIYYSDLMRARKDCAELARQSNQTSGFVGTMTGGLSMKLARVILFTGQMEAMSRFYGQVLGLKVVTEEKGWREFAAGGATIALHSGPASPGRKGPKIVFYAEDVVAMREELVARGAKFGKVRQGEELCLCDGKDPDGNPIQLSNR